MIKGGYITAVLDYSVLEGVKLWNNNNYIEPILIM